MSTGPPPAALTSAEGAIDARFRALLTRLPRRGPAGWLAEFLAFGFKQAWACVFGGAMLAVIFAAHLWYPRAAAFARNDVLTLAAVAIQIAMVAGRLETLRELRVVLLFHLVGTGMELFKTHIGSWSYAPGGLLRLGTVPLFSGFMYAAVGSYLVRVNRLFDLRFTRYPRRWVTAVVAAAIYANFFANHYVVDARWSHAWLYPSQLGGWHPVSPTKLASWFLLMIISVVLVTWISPPRAPDEPPRAPDDPQPAGAVDSADPRCARVA